MIEINSRISKGFGQHNEHTLKFLSEDQFGKLRVKDPRMLEKRMKLDENKSDVKQYNRRAEKADRRELHTFIAEDRRSGIADRRSTKRKRDQGEESSQ